jgi:protein-S-isoprenylcysteine O-methyltransferase Ste14
MKPLPFVFPYSLIFWLVFVWAYSPEFGIIRRARLAARQPGSVDAGSCRVIIIGMWIALFGAFPLAWVHALQLPKSWATAVFIVGLMLLVAGTLLRRHCFRMLGSSFTGDVRARAGQSIVTSGAYRLLRHPSYTAGTMMNAGIGLALGSWASAALLVVLTVAVYIYRMSVEERALLNAVGEPYREFMRTRKRLIPYVY